MLKTVRPMKRLRDLLDEFNVQTTALGESIGVDPLDTSPELSETQLEAAAFVLAIGRALHTYGSPAHRIEDALQRISRRLGLRGQFFSTPTSLLAAFGDDVHQRTFLARVEPGEVDLSKLCMLDRVLEQVATGVLNPEQALREVRSIVERPRQYSTALTLASFVVAPAGASIFFGGTWREMVAAGISGLLIGMLALCLKRLPNANRLFDILGGFTASAVAVVCAGIFGPLSVETATLAGVIILLPGLTLTVALNELATRHLASGTARFMGAMTILMSLGFGVAIGIGLLKIISVPEAVSAAQFITPLWILAATVFITAIALTVLFQAEPRDFPAIAAASMLAFFGARYGSAAFGPYLGVALGSFIVASASNCLARWRNRPTAVTMLPGLILLVPGSLGFRSLSSLLEHDVANAIDAGFSMLMIAVSIVAGLFVAAAVLPPRKAL